MSVQGKISHSSSLLMLGMNDFWDEQAKWSQATFGSDISRGPIGPLKHLKKEIDEGIEAAELLAKVNNGTIVEAERGVEHVRWLLLMEIVDMQLLVFDSCRRAGGTYEQMLRMCFDKLAINKTRLWAKPTSDEPVEHVRRDDGHPPPAPKGM